jgi:hypothetical protein
MLKSAYPFVDWQPWRFVHIRVDVDWVNPCNWERFLGWICNKYGIVHPEDWTRITLEDIEHQNGRGFLDRFDSGNMISKLLERLYPEYNWPHWKFKVLPASFWSDQTNGRNYFLWITSRQVIIHLINGPNRINSKVTIGEDGGLGIRDIKGANGNWRMGKHSATFRSMFHTCIRGASP